MPNVAVYSANRPRQDVLSAPLRAPRASAMNRGDAVAAHVPAGQVMPRSRSGGGRAVARPLDFRTCVHDDVEAGILRALGCLLIDDAKLEPDAPRADRDRLSYVVPGLVRATEDVDDVDLKVDVGEVGVTSLAKNRFGQRFTGTIRIPLACRNAATSCAALYSWRVSPTTAQVWANKARLMAAGSRYDTEPPVIHKTPRRRQCARWSRSQPR